MSRVANLRRTDATRRAQRVRDGVLAVDDVLDTLVEIEEHQDWLALGYKSWTEYYEGEFGPAVLKLTQEQRGRVIGVLVGAGMSRRKAAKALGVSEGTVRNDLKARGAQNYALPSEETQVKADDEVANPVAAFDEKYSDTAAGGLNVAPPVDGVTPGPTEAEQMPASGPVPPAIGDGPDVTPTDSSPEASEASTGEAPAAGDRNGHRAGADPAVIATTGRPGIEPPIAVGEAPVHASVPAAGVPPLVDDGEGVDRDEVEGEPEPSPSTDLGSDFMGGWRELVRFVLRADAEALGPWLMEAEFSELYGDLELLRERIKKLQSFAG